MYNNGIIYNGLCQIVVYLLFSIVQYPEEFILFLLSHYDSADHLISDDGEISSTRKNIQDSTFDYTDDTKVLSALKKAFDISLTHSSVLEN